MNAADENMFHKSRVRRGTNCLHSDDGKFVEILSTREK